MMKFYKALTLVSFAALVGVGDKVCADTEITLVKTPVGAEVAREGSLLFESAKPITVSVHNPPTSFFSELFALDLGLSVVSDVQPPDDFFERDVWVYFFGNKEEIKKSDGVISKIFPRLKSETTDRSVVSVGMKLENRRVLLIVAFTDGLADMSPQQISCLAASRVILGSTGNDTQSKTSKYHKYCEDRAG